MSVPSTPQDLINLIREKLFNNTSGKIDEPSIREVLEWMVKVLDAKFSFFSPTLTEEQYAQWNLMLDYMLRETKGVLTTSSTAPTENGKYLLSGAGTFNNLGGLVTTADKLNYAYFDGTTWSLIGVEVTNSNGNSSEGELINFSPNIYFNKNLAIASKTINAPITFIPTVNGDAILGGSTLVRLIADGTNAPNFSNFKKLNGSQDFSNIAGTLNACYFFYDGIDAWVNIWQGIGSSNIVTNETTPPSAPTLTSSNITENSVVLAWSGATDNIGVASYEIYKDGVLIDTVSASPYTVTGLSASTTYAFTVKAKDAAGNTSNSSNSVSVTTSAIIIENVVFDSLSDATYNSGTNTLSSSTANTGGLKTSPISGDFEVWSENTITDASVIALKSSTLGGYTWTGSNNTQFLISAYFYGGKLNVTINSSSPEFQSEINTTDTKIKMKRVGNDCQVLSSSDGITWTLRHTQTGVFSGITNIFVQGIFAINQANTMSLKLKQL